MFEIIHSLIVCTSAGICPYETPDFTVELSQRIVVCKCTLRKLTWKHLFLSYQCVVIGYGSILWLPYERTFCFVLL
jgi:hypothetical protein